jgi:hypothetical protein
MEDIITNESPVLVKVKVYFAGISLILLHRSSNQISVWKVLIFNLLAQEVPQKLILNGKIESTMRVATQESLDTISNGNSYFVKPGLIFFLAILCMNKEQKLHNTAKIRPKAIQ